MDPNRPTEQQQPQSQAEGGLQLRRPSRPASSQSNNAGTSAGHSDMFLEPGTTRSDIAQPAPLRRVPDESDIEGGPTNSLTPLSRQRVVTPERHHTSTTSSEVTPLPPAMVSSPRSITLSDNNANRTLHSGTYSNLGSTAVPPTRESRRTSSGPEQHLDRRSSAMMRTGTAELDWIVPVEEKSTPPHREKTVAERLEPTLLNAIAEKTKYATKARLTGLALNIAIGLQVLLGSLTTALSVVTKGAQTAIMTAVLGGFMTVVASYLARARGSNEPELSITRVKDLEHFIRECEAFKLDHGHVMGDKFDKELGRYRDKFEELLGNANGERKLSPV